MPLIACISDIHFHQYGNGITLNDMVKMGDDFIGMCKARHVDMIILGGDYSLSRNPTYEVSLELFRFFKKLSSLGIPIAVLIGNHDRTGKSEHSLHIIEHIKEYCNDFPNITVMDVLGLYKFSLAGPANVCIYAIPSGHQMEELSLSNDNFNICVFHDIVIGSSFMAGPLADTGLQPEAFSNKGFDIVLGGDNHKPQPLNGIVGCHGWYIGAPVQHNWGDSGDVRGFGLVKFNSHLPWNVEYTLEKYNGPEFKKVEWSVKDMSELISQTQQISLWQNNVIRLTISGPADVLNNIDVQLWSEKLKDVSQARQIEIKLSYPILQQPTVEAVLTDSDEWMRFIKSTPSADNIDPTLIYNVGIEYIREIK